MNNRPLIAAHRVNSLHRLKRALSYHVDLIEVDVTKGYSGVRVKHVDDYYAFRLTFLGTRYRLLHGIGPAWLRRVLLRPNGLEDLVEAVNGRVGVIVDLKCRGVGEEAVNALIRAGFRGRAFLTGKFHDELSKVKQVTKGVDVLVTLESRPVGLHEYLGKLGVDGVSIKYPFIDEDLVEELHSSGYIVAAWVVNDWHAAFYLANIGVDVIITDEPQKVLAAIKDHYARAAKSSAARE